MSKSVFRIIILSMANMHVTLCGKYFVSLRASNPYVSLCFSCDSEGMDYQLDSWRNCDLFQCCAVKIKSQSHSQSHRLMGLTVMTCNPDHHLTFPRSTCRVSSFQRTIAIISDTYTGSLAASMICRALPYKEAQSI